MMIAFAISSGNDPLFLVTLLMDWWPASELSCFGPKRHVVSKRPGSDTRVSKLHTSFVP